MKTWLSAVRELRGLTQRDLSRLAQVSVPTIARLESGHHEPSSETAYRLAQALGTPLTTLFPRKGQPSPPDVLAEYLSTIKEK